MRYRGQKTGGRAKLIRGDQQGAAADPLRRLIAEGIASGTPAPVDKAYWAAKRKQLLALRGSGGVAKGYDPKSTAPAKR